jgi:predicted methyltransferase
MITHALRRPPSFMIGSLIFVTLASVCATTATAQDKYRAIVTAPDRTYDDLQIDKRRDPVKFLAFTAARPGLKVLDIGAGGGYSTELMARAIAPTGVVYGQNPPDLVERAKTRFETRLNTPAGKNIVSLVQPFDDPLPDNVRDLDLITFLFFYHDTTYMNVDRAEMNRKLYAALKPGGILVIADHSARAGDGVSVGKTLHRIEESTLRREVEAAGFKLVAKGDFWRHREDARDFSVERPSGRVVDEFVLKFQK